MNGRISDGGIWARCDLRQKLDENSINLPEPKNMPGTQTPVSFHIVSDAAFPLGLNIMKPFPECQVTGNVPNRVYNYRYLILILFNL